MNLLLPEGLWGHGIQSQRLYKHFKRGNKVMLTHSFRNKLNIGATGTIIDGDGSYFYVAWDNANDGLSSTVGILPSRIELLNSEKRRQN